MSEKGHTTRRGALFAALECDKRGPGHYWVEGHDVVHVVRKSTTPWGNRVDHWEVSRDGKRVARRENFTEALEWIAEQLEHRHGRAG